MTSSKASAASACVMFLILVYLPPIFFDYKSSDEIEWVAHYWKILVATNLSIMGALFIAELILVVFLR